MYYVLVFISWWDACTDILEEGEEKGDGTKTQHSRKTNFSVISED